MSIKNYIIFTDLDGTLLDHNNYSFEDALPMIDFIKMHKMPLIIVTSKTKSEVIYLQKLLGIHNPFIVENGAGAFIPTNDGYEMFAFGKEYAYVRDCFVSYAKSIDMRGFFDMSVDEIVRLTGLNHSQATHAKERSFTEPFILYEENRLAELEEMAHLDGLAIVQGGRFYHLITKGEDKATAIKNIITYCENSTSMRYKTIALGDSQNDLSMLESVDKPILIPHPDGSYIPCDIEGLIKAPYPGPQGWNIALKEYFNVS